MITCAENENEDSHLPFQCSHDQNEFCESDVNPGFSHLKFLLECFVLSFGPEGPQLGRNHPQSEPELYASGIILPVEQINDAESFYSSRRSSNQENIRVPFIRMCEGVSCRARAARRIAEVDLQIHTSLDGVFPFPDDYIVRELSEMRTLLERLLENRETGVEWQRDSDLLDILGFLPPNLSIKEPPPHFPVGAWDLEECGICFQVVWLYRRSCCGFPACTICLQTYYSTKINQGEVRIECCNPTCRSYVHRDEVSARLPPQDKEIFYRLLARVNEDGSSKTCPRCNYATKMETHVSRLHKDSGLNMVVCPSCQLDWCYSCHAPWHSDLTCKQYRKGDRLLKIWAKETTQSQLNAQRCPKCKIYIQRTSGCDHMTCARCKTDFCYRCGDKLRRLKFFGDHYSKLSVFGCKYGYKTDKPVQRKVIRGAIFGSKLMAVPVVGSVALCAGAMALGLGVFLLPLYGGFVAFRKLQTKKGATKYRRLPAAFRRFCGRYLE